MPVIYSYPLVTSLSDSDLLLITSRDEDDELFTGSVKYETLKDSILSSFSGTDNYIPKFYQGALVDSAIYQNGINIGIGTTSPAKKLSVQGGGFDMFADGGTAADVFTVTTHQYAFNDENEDVVYSYDGTNGHEFSTQGTQQLYIKQNGNIGIGTNSPQYKLDVNGDVRVTQDNQLILSRNSLSAATSDSCIYVDNAYTGGGNPHNIDSDLSSYFGSRHIGFRFNGTIVGYIGASGPTAVTYSTTSSDERLKKNIEDWQENILDKFEQIEPKKFNFITETDGGSKTKGFIAQNMVGDFPEAYPHDYSEDQYYSFNPSGMVIYLMKAVKELVDKNKELEARIQILENQ